MTQTLDHFIYAARELEPMRRQFESLTGVAAGLGGRHPGRGTRNALASLGESVYLELLAIDDEQQAPESGLGGPIKAFDTPRLFAYMVKNGGLEAAQQVLTRHGIESDLFDASRKTLDGQTLRWRLLVPHDDNRFGHFTPKLIDWLDTPHPARTSTRGCSFQAFALGHPDAQALNELLRELHVGIAAQRSDRPWMRLDIETPRGPLALTSQG